MTLKVVSEGHGRIGQLINGIDGGGGGSFWWIPD